MKSNKQNKKKTIFLFLFRSAPTSPSHMSDMFTPDNLSRETSPTPESEENMNHTQQILNSVQQRPAPLLPPSAAELRISQSAPPSPAGTILQGRLRVFRIILVFRILRPTFCGKSASKC